ncbi:MAG: hypothetical protein AB1757_11175 [Acidobacteriota bacterium]
MPLSKSELKQLGDTLHARLLEARDDGVVSEISEHFLQLLVKSLSRRFYKQIHDPHIIASAAIDALMSFLKQPEKYVPARSKNGLFGYLFMIAARDLFTILNRQKAFVPVEAIDSEILSRKRRSDTPERKLLEDELLREIQSPLNEVDKKIVALMLDGVRGTEHYVEILGIQDKPAMEQAVIVKMNKDRLKKSLKKLIRKLGYISLPGGLILVVQRWAKAATQKAVPHLVNLLAIAILVATNALILHKHNREVQAAHTTNAFNQAPQQRPAPNGMKGRWVEKIFFASNRAKEQGTIQRHIWMINPDGSQPEQVTFGDVADESVKVSPDGTRIAFTRRERPRAIDEGNASSSIFIKDLLTGEEIPVTDKFDYPNSEHYSFGPGWSPDGTKIAFARKSSIDPDGRGKFGNLWIMEISPAIGEPYEPPQEKGWGKYAPSWSADGKTILFMKHLWVDGQLTIFRLDLTTGREEEVIPLVENEYQPKYSPDRNKILWITYRHSSNGGDIYIADVADPVNTQYRVTTFSGWEESDWSPDGTRVVSARHSYQLNETSYKTMPLAHIPDDVIEKLQPLKDQIFSKEEEFLTAVSELLGANRTKIYSYRITQHGNVDDEDLWMMDIDGSNPVQITAGADSDEAPCWAYIFQPE